MAKTQLNPDAVRDNSVTKAKLVQSVQMLLDGAVQSGSLPPLFGAMELTTNAAQNKTAITALLAAFQEVGIDTANGYSVAISYIEGNKEYHGMLTAGKNNLLNGLVCDALGSSYFSFSVGVSDGVVTFDGADPVLFKNGDEFTTLKQSFDKLIGCVEFTETTLSNKAQLDAYLEKIPNAKTMCCTYKGIYAGNINIINGDWYGVLVKNTNAKADLLPIKLSPDGTLVEGA